MKSIQMMSGEYPRVGELGQEILDVILREEDQFGRTLLRGLKEFEESASSSEIDGKKLFYLYETYGFPLELSLEELRERSIAFDEGQVGREFQEEQRLHRVASQQSGVRRFAGGLADHSRDTIRYHTAAHLLLRALQVVVSPSIHQEGSNITASRLRYDFNLDRALTAEEIGRIEALINNAIDSGLDVQSIEMGKEEARASEVEGVFWEKYPAVVTVYQIGEAECGGVFSRELCGGPHVGNTRELGEMGKFSIVRQENLGGGKRRIRAELR
jgi:alanyl-tRNA synthetase